jgi:hypothetical protein
MQVRKEILGFINMQEHLENLITFLLTYPEIISYMTAYGTQWM